MIIFGNICDRDSIFYLDVAKQIKEIDQSIDIVFISFYEPANRMIEKNGFKVYNIYKYIKNKAEVDFLDYGIEDINNFVLHESLTFNKSKNFVSKKYKRYISAFDNILLEIKDSIREDVNITIFQELGGFVANLSLYFCAKKYKINHYFFEPSLFDGMLFLIKNDFRSIKDLDTIVNNNHVDIRKILDSFDTTQPSVIPDKDKHLFKQNILLKVFNLRNLKKFIMKIINKYVLFKREEFNHIFNHITRNIKTIVHSSNLQSLYSKDIKLGRNNLYFPLHVPFDIQLTIRSPKNINQLDLANQVLELSQKKDFKLFIKEHPAMIGSYDSTVIKNLLKKYPNNFVILHPSMNTYDIIDEMDAIVTINSKVGAEALSRFKKVLVLGDAFYSPSKVENFDSIVSLNAFLSNSNFDYTFNKEEKEDIDNFFKKVYQSSYPMELYLHNNKNINIFANKLLSLT